MIDPLHPPYFLGNTQISWYIRFYPFRIITISSDCFIESVQLLVLLVKSKFTNKSGLCDSISILNSNSTMKIMENGNRVR